MRKKAERRLRWETLVADPGMPRRLFSFIAGGGTLSQWSLDEDVKFTSVQAWLNADPARQQAMARAEEVAKRDRISLRALRAKVVAEGRLPNEPGTRH